MLTRICTILILAAALNAQQPVAPTPEPVGSPRGDTAGNYNVMNSFETGYRWRLVDGNLGKYRADVNYGNGIRLLGSTFSMYSKDGHGQYFDEILLNTLGLGNDPYQSASLRIQKNNLYRYDMLWRLNDYYNPGLTISAGEHLTDTTRRLLDNDLTLMPLSAFHVRLGYSRNDQTGPALSSVQEFDSRGDSYVVFSNVRREWNEYRLGLDVTAAGFKFTLLRRWDFYKEDTPYQFHGNEPASTPGDLTVLQNFARSAPYHGSNPGWLGNLVTQRKRWSMNARATYVSGSRDFALDESASGLSRFGAAANRQILVNGTAQRPSMASDFNFSYFPTERLTLVNNTSVQSTRIDGDATYTEFANGSGLGTTFNFRYWGVRTVGNSTDANYRANNWLSVYTGYAYSNRLIKTIEHFELPGVANSSFDSLYEQTNALNTGRLGFRIKPIKPLTINVEGEVGRASQPFTPFSERNYHTINGRVDYRLKKLQLSASYKQFYNTNSVSLSIYDSHSRNYTASASWAPYDWFSLDASYVKLHLDALGSLAFFAGSPRSTLQTAYSSLYVSNLHAANLGTRFTIRKRADVYLGYSITKDTGDGRATAVPAGVTDPIQALLSGVQTFPLSFQSPMARVSIRISPKVRWNAGWQFYNYSEEFNLLGFYQNYHANTGYTSILWSF